MRFRVLSKIGFFFVAVLLLIFAGCLPSFVRADQSSAGAELASARSKIVECFNAAKAAEASGANISYLISDLNYDSSILARAEQAFSSGDFSRAQTIAIQSQNQLGNFVSTANSLKTAATQRQNMAFVLNFVGSIIGAIAVLVGSVLVWVLLKRKYERVGEK